MFKRISKRCKTKWKEATSHGKSISCLDSSRCRHQECVSFAVLSHRTAQGHWQRNPYANGPPLCLMTTNTNFVYVNDGQPWCAHTDRCIHKHTQTRWTLPIPEWSDANAPGRWHTALVSSCVWLPLYNWDRDICLLIKVGLAGTLTSY